MEPPQITYEKEDYSEILAKDRRYDSRAYDFVLEAVHAASERANGHVSGRELLDWFADLAHDAYGPLAFTVLKDWGVESCEDVGEIVFNLCRVGRIGKRESDTPADFIGAYDFREEFLAPYEP